MKRLYPALLAATLAACQPAAEEQAGLSTGTSAASDVDLCSATAIPISKVQGEAYSSPLEGQTVTVRGVVTLVEPDGGLFFQEAHPFSSDRVSHGLYVAPPGTAEGISGGDLIALTGVVGELGDGDDTLTAILKVLDLAICGPGPEPPVFDARLPLNPDERETFEAMRVTLEQPLTVTAVADVAEGRITVSTLGLLRAPTEAALPGPEALAHERKNRDWSLPVRNEGLRDLEPFTKIHAGALIHLLSGVLGHDGAQPILIAEGDLDPVARHAPEVAGATQGAIRVASFNLHEYFNGDGQGGGFPGERGARTAREFERQAARIHAAVREIRPDILAVQELENDGFGHHSAVQALGRSLTATLGVAYEVAAPGSERAGSDAISVGLLYRPDRLAARGPARLLEGGSFGALSRVPLAQLFRERTSGTEFLVVVSHLKSKSFCPESGPDADQGDGQACWNPTRVEGARETVRWARRLGAEADTDHLLLAGDFNAYRQEDPVRAVLEEGLLELVALHQPGMPHYSYIYRGAAGTLDYAFASAALADLSSNAFIWHINAAYPWSSRPSEPWLRSSDHDPVVVDLRFSQPATSD